MKRLLSYAFCLCFVLPASAEWDFAEPIKIAPKDKGQHVFHHLDASGRNNIAISDDIIAIIWEDNHSGSPQAYVAFKTLADEHFGSPLRVSTGREAYEPAITALGSGRFLMGWEQDGRIWLRSGTMHRLNPAVQASTKEARQISLAVLSKAHAIAAWAQQASKFSQIVTATISLRDGNIDIDPAIAVDPAPPTHDQSYPVLASTRNHVTLIWEDRRRGHTMLLQSYKKTGKPFAPARVLNEIVKKSSKYGGGSGVTRVALARCDEQHMLATWMDKRNRQTGYDIYAAQSADGGKYFGKNESVQDSFGDNIAQWNPAVACDATGNKVIAWYDNREESMDILLSWKTAEGWSEDMLVAPASGEGEQTNASIALDKLGDLHMVWIAQTKSGMPTSLYYATAKRRAE